MGVGNHLVGGAFRYDDRLSIIVEVHLRGACGVGAQWHGGPGQGSQCTVMSYSKACNIVGCSRMEHIEKPLVERDTGGHRAARRHSADELEALARTDAEGRD
ncbi:MAG TPA: hypothetical protein VFA32_23895 [Dehalococcoidia bacterium]|nr:hypothetical protein [Dehalococcoidia bacterium]